MIRAMKPSGIEWIGEIPEGWNTRKLKSVSSLVSGFAFPSEDFTDIGIPVIRIGDLGDELDFINCAKVSFEKYQDMVGKDFTIHKNDIIVAMTGATIGKNLFSRDDYTAFINQRVGIIRKITENISQVFLFFIFNSEVIQKQIMFECIGGAQDNIGKQQLSSFRTPFPPLHEQQAIADYLDRKSEIIDSTIEKQKTVIEKLKLYKQSVITEAVTKGLDPTVKMKPSGIEWIGYIPEGWEVKRLKSILKKPLQYGANDSGEEFSEFLPRYIRITDISSENALKGENKLSLDFKKAKPYILFDGDLLFARSGATVGKSFIFKKEYGESAFAGYLIRAIIDENNTSRFIYYFSLSLSYEEWKKRIFIQATIQNIGANKYNNLEIPLPPLPEEQAIADYLDVKCSQIDNIIEQKQKLIEKLSNYKKSLIYECVTGKREVIAG